MNLLIIEPHDFISDRLVRIADRRHQHISSVLKSKLNDTLTVGLLNSNIGKARILELSTNNTLLEIINIDQEPPATIPLTIILGLPRPRMLQRTLQTIATMGVEKLCLIQTNRVEKSFWQTPLLQAHAIKEQLILGLEQGKSTQLPSVEFHTRFLPYIEDTVVTQAKSTNKIIAHPGDYPIASSVDNQPCTLAIGPEGGFIQKEVDLFIKLGFNPVQLGERILRVETAIPVLIAKLY